MTTPTPTPNPIDVSGIDEPLPDLGHEAIRTAALNAIQTVWANHEQLVTALAASRVDLTNAVTALGQAQAAIADLRARVTALETPPAPTP